MDMQLLIALIFLLLSVGYLGNKFLGKRLKSPLTTDKSETDEDTSCGPSCKCGR